MSRGHLHERLPDRFLLIGGHVYSPVDPFATAMMVIDNEIVWIGSDAGATVHQDSVDVVIHLESRLVTPAFVDAHVHATATGLGILGLDLSQADSPEYFLMLLRQYCSSLPPDAVVWGHGWDDSGWAQGVPDRDRIDVACGGRVAYLSRVDVHSAVVSSELIRRCPRLEEEAGFDPIGALRMSAHLRARSFAFAALSTSQRHDAQRAMLSEAARHGIASVHEMAGPGISSAGDLESLSDLGRDPSQPEVIGYWGALADVETARGLGASGCAGDLFVDGSLGSHTACLREPYADRPTETGVSYLSDDEVADHIIRCTQAQIQAGFHVIGDAAMDIVCSGLSLAKSHVGAAALRRSGHRLEHAEMMDEGHLRMLADLNVTVSMQPAFDAAWGGEDGMYQARLGARRAADMNSFAQVMSAGIPLAFGSDSPVTPLRPWEAVRAAASHQAAGHAISARAAFLAHTRGGRRAAGQGSVEPGVLREGAPATFAVWAADNLVVHAPDETIASWSTDPRSGTPGLPDLSSGAPIPECLLTVRQAQVIHRAEGFAEGLSEATG
jgi:predicted amidohydrolase YtcJ